MIAGNVKILSAFASHSVLLASAGIAGFGVVSLALVLSAPTPLQSLPDKTVPRFSDHMPLAVSVVSDSGDRSWASVFGQVQPKPDPSLQSDQNDTPPIDIPVADPAANFDPDAYILQGIVTGTSGEDRAMIAVNGATFLFKTGEMLAENVEIVAITSDGVKINASGKSFMLEFSDPPKDTGTK